MKKRVLGLMVVAALLMAVAAPGAWAADRQQLGAAKVLSPKLGTGKVLSDKVGIGKVMLINRAALLSAALDKDVTLEGFFYDGSIPMLLNDINLVGKNELLPPDSYVPLHGSPVKGAKSGDRISITGRLTRPNATLPIQLRNETAVFQVQASSTVKVLKLAPQAIGKLARVRFDASRFTAFLTNKYAALISGGGNAASNHLRYWNEVKASYNMLRAKGWPAANIYVVYADGVGRDNTVPVNYGASKANIATVFNQLASKMKAADELYIGLNDHGGGDHTLILWNGQRMTDAEFATEVNKVSQYAKMVVQMEQCYSGSFLDNLAGPRRVMAAACTANQPSWAMPPSYTWNWFTYYWIAALTGQKPDGTGAVNADANGDGKVSYTEAFNFARANDHGDEIPQFEDNGAAPSSSGVMPQGTEGVLGASWKF